MKRVLLYARVSTSDKGQNPEVQLADLRRYSTAREWHIVEELVDHGYSGGSDDRPALKQVMSMARTRRADVILVTKLDRLARSLKHLVALLDEFGSLGIQFVSISDQIDMTTASGRLMLHIVAAFAEFERSLIRERTIAGLAFAKSQGRRLGRPPAKREGEILRLRAAGLSYREISRQLGVSRGAVYRAVKSGPKTSKNLTVKDESDRGPR